ncbi:MAG: putative ABC transporter permease [Lachnospiraceae bacterium]|nr:putative ABC transporter permease [Lachnospiraceae bacterium]
MSVISDLELDEKMQELSVRSAVLLEDVEVLNGRMQEYYPQLLNMERTDVMTEEVRRRAEKLTHAGETLWKASSLTYDMGDELRARWTDLRKSDRKHSIFAPPANAAIDIAEESTDHFAKGLNYYKLFILCFVASFLGVVIETLFVLASRGILMNRTGLVYGPFNLLYGVGAVVLTLALYRFRNRGIWLSFLGGMIIGSSLEYLCSWVQEMVLGSRSWDYSHAPFNINGRICLLYVVFWGILGVLWIKNIYPRMTRWILKLPRKPGKAAVWVLTVLLMFNIAVSGISVFRWSRRIEGIPAKGPFWETVDQCFPDERMEQTFPSMKFTSN